MTEYDSVSGPYHLQSILLLNVESDSWPGPYHFKSVLDLNKKMAGQIQAEAKLLTWMVPKEIKQMTEYYQNMYEKNKLMHGVLQPITNNPHTKP